MAPSGSGNPRTSNGDPERTPSAIDLNGTWEFTPTGWSKTSILVPGFYIWQAFADTGIVNPWTDCALGRVVENQPEVKYEKRFSIPSSMAGQRIILQFEAVNFLADVYIDNQFVGTHIGGYMPFEFDITPFVSVPSTPKVKVYILYNDSRLITTDGKPLWPVGYYGNLWDLGIVGDVRVIGRSPCFVADSYIQTSVRSHLLTAYVTVRNTDTADHDITVQSNVEKDGSVVRTVGTQTVHVHAGEETCVTFERSWSNPTLWSPANPHLYDFVCGITIDGSLQDEKSTRFGFREFWIEGTEYRLNGNRVNLRGDNVAIHGEKFNWEYLVPTPENWASILDSLRALHINMIRMSNAPPSWVFDVCDEKGLLVIADSPICSRPNVPKYNTTFTKNCITWAREWIVRDRNHPSIVVWSAENEMRQWLRLMTVDAIKQLGDSMTETDPTRPVMYEGDEDLSGNSVIHSYHYILGFPTGWPKAGIYTLETYLNPNKPTSYGEFDWYAPTVIPESRRHRRQCVQVRTCRILNFADVRPFRMDWAWHPNHDYFEIYDGTLAGESEILFLENSYNPVAVFDKYYYANRDEAAAPEYNENDEFTRTLVVFNDDESGTEITVQWKIILNDVVTSEGSFVTAIPLGGHEEREITFHAPYVSSKQSFYVELNSWKQGVQRFSERTRFQSINTGITPPPRQVSGMAIQKTTQGIMLSWSPVTTNEEGSPATIDHYIVSQSPRITFPSDSTSTTNTGLVTSFLDPSSFTHLGHPGRHMFYRTRAVDNNGQISDNSAILGEVEYSLVPTSRTGINGIALPVLPSGMTDSDDLLHAVSNCDAVFQWNASTQAYQQYIPSVPGTLFSVSGGKAYFVNVTASSLLLLLGPAADFQNSLSTTSTTNFNTVMLPLDELDIENASDLISNIPSSNGAARWIAAEQHYEQYIPSISPTDFEVFVGQPYFIHMAGTAHWPKTLSPNDLPASSTIGLSVPHAVWGTYLFETEPSNSQGLHFQAYVLSRRSEVLTEESPGCMIEDGYWVVQCGSFSTQWQAQDTLRIVFSDDSGLYNAEGDVILTYASTDEAGEILLKMNRNLPVRFHFSSNFPNPFNDQTHIRCDIPEKTHIRIDVINGRGQIIKTLVDQSMMPGTHDVVWTGSDLSGLPAPSGVYIIRILAQTCQARIKTLLIR